MKKPVWRWLPVALVLALGGGWLYGEYRKLDVPQPRDRDGFVGSTACQSCHADHHASWSRTYHRTMTQEATPASVQGRFDGTVVHAWGVDIRPVQRDGHYFFDYLKPDGSLMQSVRLDRTVGSHRYQQYLSRDADGRYARMHLIWHNGDQRWVHYNGAFLYDDHQGFNQHAAVWNPNCIFCHNTGPNPNIQNEAALRQRVSNGESFNYLNAAHWDSQVAELGIACEACHGPGATHAAANRNPVRRYRLHLSGAADATITNPRRLTPARSAEVCGQCHGQRMPASDALTHQWLRSGPTYRAGDALEDHVRLVTQQTTGTDRDPAMFALRFWKDGTPRLSAYELQGLQQSRCYRAGGATCIGCHEAHGGDPAGMITATNRAGASCVGCHPDAATMPVHRPHLAASAETNCVDCHMPKMVYGVMEIHRTHRIAKPQPQAAAAAGKPDSCTGCHGSRSASWAADTIAHWKAGTLPVLGDDPSLPENLRQLFAGDAVQRAVAARMAGDARNALRASERQAQLPLLFAAMDDAYPAVRRFAWQSATETATQLKLAPLSVALRAFDFVAPAQQRLQALAAIRAAAPPSPPATDRFGGLLQADGQVDALLLRDLRAQADSTAINIGE
jgi:predicted CXXCH cytochrome family protein